MELKTGNKSSEVTGSLESETQDTSGMSQRTLIAIVVIVVILIAICVLVMVFLRKRAIRREASSEPAITNR